jgi:hypothetical protein
MMRTILTNIVSWRYNDFEFDICIGILIAIRSRKLMGQAKDGQLIIPATLGAGHRTETAKHAKIGN